MRRQKNFLRLIKTRVSFSGTDKEYVKKVLPLVQDRARTLADVPELTRFFFVEDLDYDSKLLIEKGMFPADCR